MQELDNIVNAEDFWNDNYKAAEILKEKSVLVKDLGDFTSLDNEFKDIVAMLQEVDNDDGFIEELCTELQRILEIAEKMEIDCLLSSPADKGGCFFEIHSGAGGTEANDWANMLLRMYSRWMEKRGFTITTLSSISGDAVGVKSVVLKVSGKNVYGWTKSESGVHRLVRLSPFDSNNKRHTSFASVTVSPVIEDDIAIELPEKELKIDTYKSSGAGGQHVNTTDSAVRITHLPTGIVVQCQNERSQHQNKAQAMNMLRSKLYELELQKREAEILKECGSKMPIGWGHQIRSYVFQPYQMIKDLRTGYEVGNVQAVMDGDLDDFIRRALAERIRK